MSDDADEVDTLLSELDAAKDADTEDAAAKTFQPAPAAEQNSVVRWMTKLPRNVGVGVLDAAIAAGHFVSDISGKDALLKADDASRASGIDIEGQPTAPLQTPAQRRVTSVGQDDFLSVADKSILEFRDHLAKDSSTADSITQGVAQFAVPFAGWLKYIRAAGAGAFASSVGAEAAAVGTSFEAQAPRMADLLELGRHAEGRLGAAMRGASPDGSMLNAYINYMTDREDESAAEGRFKNVVDSLATSAAVAGIFKTGALALKSGRQLLAKPPVVRPPAPVLAEVPAPTVPEVAPAASSPGNPFAVEAYRGVGAGADPLDNSASYGNALFFTPHESVAQFYAGGTGSVSKHSLNFKNMLDATTIEDARAKLALKPDAELDQVVNAARKAGYDGLTYDLKTGKMGREYVSIPPLKE